MAEAYIDDGQTRRGYLREVQRLHPACRFEWRPITAAERAIIIGKVADANERQAIDIASALVASRVTKWNLTKPDGEPVNLQAAEVGRVVPALMLKVYRVLLGDNPPDADPDEQPTQEDGHKSDRELQALLEGRPSEDTQEGREGN